jgi:prepilin signal peptidase PulO-like enzyme (type II secretory pathway)
MWTFVIAAAVIALLLGIMSYVAERRFHHEENRRTPGYALLPGDIKIERGNVRFYFPIATSIVLSIVLSLLLRFFS